MRNLALSVLDQLARDGQPKSLAQLVSYMWDSNPVIASAAAWRLAPMLRVANVPYGDLPAGPPERSSAPWAWEPFGVPAPMKAIVGRAVWLLANSPDESVVATVPGQLPPEIVLPAIVLVSTEIAALPFGRVWKMGGDPSGPGIRSMRATVTNAQLGPEAEAQVRAAASAGKGHTEETPTIWFVEEGLQKGNASARVRSLLHCLGATTQLTLTQNFKFGRPATPEDWLALFRRTVACADAKPQSGRAAGWTFWVAVAVGVWAYSVDHWLVMMTVVAIAVYALFKMVSRGLSVDASVPESPLQGGETLILGGLLAAVANAEKR
jgi:hypothetical protein